MLPDREPESAQKHFGASLIGHVDHDAADKEGHTGIEAADVFTMDDVGDTVAVEQALDHRELANVLRVGEMNHPHEPPTDRSFTRETCP